MEIPYIRGLIATQAHVKLPAGTVEEEYGREGFFGRYAHLYRTHAPTSWTRIEGPLRPRAFMAMEGTPARGADTTGLSRRLWLVNEDARISTASIGKSMPFFFRNADADELFFLHQGHGILETDFGPLRYEAGDYLLVPRGTSYRFVPAQATKLLLVESTSAFDWPERGMLGQHALFDPAVLTVPSPDPSYRSDLGARDEYEVRVLRGGEISSIFYPHSPHDVVGWKGTLCAVKLNVRDIRPVISERYHLPPSAHTTLVAKGVVVCTFAPRGLETEDKDALRVPFYHSNIDYDEVLFYHAGDFFSRAGIGPGMMTFHPQGIPHGPQPQAVERSATAERTNEIAVMIDTRRPLTVARDAEQHEVSDYWKSWQR